MAEGAAGTTPEDALADAVKKAETALILLEGLINYLRALNIVDVEDFNSFLQEHEVISEPIFRGSEGADMG